MEGPKYTMNDLLAVMEKLRAPDGCPWDMEQTHQSIRREFIEETYEVVEAIDTENTELLKEELGDVLFQVVFHAEIEKEKGNFLFEDVVDGVTRKMILRHPHVFGEVEVKNTEDVLANWDAIKKETKGQRTQKEVLDSVSHALPSLMRSAKVQQKAARAGWEKSAEDSLQDAEKILQALKSVSAGDPNAVQHLLGDLLFAVAGVSRSLNVDPEEALARSCDAFIQKFDSVEQEIREKQEG